MFSVKISDSLEKVPYQIVTCLFLKRESLQND